MLVNFIWNYLIMQRLFVMAFRSKRPVSFAKGSFKNGKVCSCHLSYILSKEILFMGILRTYWLYVLISLRSKQHEKFFGISSALKNYSLKSLGSVIYKVCCSLFIIWEKSCDSGCINTRNTLQTNRLLITNGCCRVRSYPQ